MQNAGFSVHWRSSDQVIMRMASYSISNRPEDALVSSPSALSAGSSSKLKPMTKHRGPIGAATLSKTMTKVSENATGVSDICFAAFKVLPVEPPRVRSGSYTRYAEPADDLAEATTCIQLVDLMVDTIRQACKDAGNPPVVMDRNIVRYATCRGSFFSVYDSYRDQSCRGSENNQYICQDGAWHEAATLAWSSSVARRDPVMCNNFVLSYHTIGTIRTPRTKTQSMSLPGFSALVF